MTCAGKLEHPAYLRTTAVLKQSQADSDKGRSQGSGITGIVPRIQSTSPLSHSSHKFHKGGGLKIRLHGAKEDIRARESGFRSKPVVRSQYKDDQAP